MKQLQTIMGSDVTTLRNCVQFMNPAKEHIHISSQIPSSQHSELELEVFQRYGVEIYTQTRDGNNYCKVIRIDEFSMERAKSPENRAFLKRCEKELKRTIKLGGEMRINTENIKETLIDMTYPTLTLALRNINTEGNLFLDKKIVDVWPIYFINKK